MAGREARAPHVSLGERLPAWAHKVRQLIPPVLAAFLCFVCTVSTKVNTITGRYAFLICTSMILFYFPQGRVTELVENNTIDFLGAVCGLAWTSAALAIAAWCGEHHGAGSSQSRAVLGVGLATLSLTCGWLRSFAPRLNVACRAALFYPIFLLTAQQDITEYHSWMFLEMFYVTLLGYAFATISGALFLEHSSAPQLGRNILGALRTTCELVPMSITAILEGEGGTLTPPHAGTPHPGIPIKTVEEGQPSSRTRQQELASELRAQLKQMRDAHNHYQMDVVHARHHPKSLIPVVRTLGRLQRNPLLGPGGHVPGDRIRTALERAYATPLSPAPSRGSRPDSRHGTPRRRTHSRGSSRFSIGSVPDSPTVEYRNSMPDIPIPDISATQLVHKLSKVATHSHPGSRHPSGQHPHADGARKRLTAACGALSDAIVGALSGAGEELALACDWRWERSSPSIGVLRTRLDDALAELEKRLSGIIDPGDSTGSSTTLSPRGVTFEEDLAVDDWLDDEDRFRIAFYMIALLDLAKDTGTLLTQAERLHAKDGPKRWFLPAVNWPWTPWPTDVKIPSVDRDVPSSRTEEEKKDHANLDFVHRLLQESRETSDARPRLGQARTWGERLTALWRSVWDRRGVVVARVFISTTFHSLKHSRHVHFAIKQAIGTSLLALPAFLPETDAGRRWYDESFGAWIVVSYMYVLEVTTGSTLRVGFYRMVGTLVGAVVAFVCTIIAHNNPYALVVLGTACAVPISYGILFTHVAPMATVTGITLPPILFIKYLGIDASKSEFHIAWERFLQITIGIAAAVLIGMWLWPIHARVQYFAAVADTMDQITEYYLRMSRDLLRPSLVYDANHRQYTKIHASVQRNIKRCRMLVDIQKRELSLLPRPIKLYSEVIDLAERLIETFTEVRILRFSLPRKATVLDVLPIRRELVSALLVNLWACGQAFRSRSPLPQLLPSPRVPLGEVMDATDTHAHTVRMTRAREARRRQRSEDDGLPGRPLEVGSSSAPQTHETPERNRKGEPEGVHAELAVLYGMAENEALGEAINSIDELLAAARTLFGTQSFLEAESFL